MLYPTDNASLDSSVEGSSEESAWHLRVAMPAIVKSFDGRQTVTVQPALSTQDADGSEMAITPLVDVPVQFPRGGKFALTFPIEAGDEGLLVISDRCIDGWFSSGATGVPPDYRMHDLSDAFFIPGVSSLKRVINDFRLDAIVMRQLDGPGYVSIDKSGNIDIDGALLTVRCPTTFLKPVTMAGTLDVSGLITFTAGMNGSGGGDITADILGEVTINGIKISKHWHTGDSGGKTGEPQN